MLWAAVHFTLTKGERTPRAALTAPTRFVAADAPPKGSAPQWQYCLGSTATCVVSGLGSGQQHLFRVAA